ncbi:hypothetical protein [Streptomyces sp. NPDC051776]|uniref:hypothetical protein n=1 Tax=Streptomyces sp. NPDC051776 TaxID=3155414 RepID=UPI003431593F
MARVRRPLTYAAAQSNSNVRSMAAITIRRPVSKRVPGPYLRHDPGQYRAVSG